MIPLFFPSYEGKEIQEEMAKLFPEDMSNRWIGEGPKTKQFEKEFGDKFNYKYCLSLNSGSAALELAYHLIGLKSGDEVITPVLTCTATNIPILRMGATPVFADIKESDFTIDPEDVQKKITTKTKAIVAVTLGGLPIDNQIFSIAKYHNLPVVIDAAQSVGISEQGGDYICYSFQAIKHFTSGDGGMLVIRDEDEYYRAKKLRWFGIDREKKIKADWQPYKNREMTMDIEEAGYKFHMNDINATLGIIGLRHSDEYLEKRKKIADYYTEELGLKCQIVAGGTYWLYGILVNHRDYVAEELKKSNIETNMAHLRNDIFTVFGGKRQNLLTMNKIEPYYLYIPLNTKITMKDAQYIVKRLKKVS